MRIAVAQVNPSLGDLEGNARKVIDLTKEKADLIIFPELTITGYPPHDLIFEPRFVQKNKEMLSYIVKNSGKPCIVGFIDEADGKRYNAAAFINKKTVHVQYKMLLPNYDVFDEKRYFTPGTSQSLIEYKGKRIGVEICEDLWDHLYDANPSKNLLKMGADILINISASPYSAGKIEERISLAQQHAQRALFIYCNLVGGQDELIFDGRSFVIQNGRLVKMGKAFQEDLFTIDTDETYPEIPFSVSHNEELFSALVLGLRDYCRKSGIRTVILGLSGGIDSSLVACIAAEAVGRENVTALFMPSQYTRPESGEDARDVAENLGIALATIPIDSIFNQYRAAFKDLFEGLEEDATEENIQARIRGNLLMAYSNKFGGLVLQTGNKTEFALGYCTLYGDMCGGLSVIGDVSKLKVYELARYYNKVKGEKIPERVFTQIPSAELKANQIDPFDYGKVSPLVEEVVEELTPREKLIEYDESLVQDTLKRIRMNEFKRKQAPPILKVTKKAFGTGRRYPLAHRAIY